MPLDWAKHDFGEASRLDRAALVERAEAGDRAVVVRLDGAREEVHAFGGAGHAFTETVRAMATARSLGLSVGVVTVVNRSNARVMSEMPALLRARGVEAWRVVMPAYAEEAELVGRAPRLVLALPPVLSALSRAQKRGLHVQLVDAPQCLLGPLRAIARTASRRAYGAPCEGCALRERCAGVDAAYLARFGDGELRQVAGSSGLPAGPGTGSPATRAGRSRSSGATSQGGSGTSSSS